MADDGTPKKGRIEQPLHPSKLVTPISQTVSSYVSSEGNRFSAAGLFEKHYHVADIQEKKIIPVDSFLLAMGVMQHSLKNNDTEISEIASRTDLGTYCNTVKEVDRYGPFSEAANYTLSLFAYTRIVFSRNDPKLLYGPYTSGGLKPDVVALKEDHEDVKDGKWRTYSSQGPVKELLSVGWGWIDVRVIVEFKKLKDKFPPNRDHVAVTWTAADASPSARLTRAQRRAAQSEPGETPSSSHASGSSSKRMRLSKDEGGPTAVISHSTPASGSRGSSTRHRAGPRRGSRRGGTGATTTSHSTSASGSERGDYVLVTPVPALPPPANTGLTSEQRRRAREEMMKEDEVDSSEKRAVATEQMERGVIPKVLELSGVKYAADLVSCVLNRRHAFALLICDGEMRLAYFDRAGPVFSEAFYFTADLYRFVLLLKRLAEMTDWEMGFLECVIMDIPPKDEILGALPALEGGNNGQNELQVTGPGYSLVSKQVVESARHKLESGEKLWVVKFDDTTYAFLLEEIGGRPHYGLITRATAVHVCYYITPRIRCFLAIKFSWVQSRRTSEADILDKARAVLRKVDADPEHRKLYGDRKLEDSLPNVIAKKDLDDLKKEGSFRWFTQFCFADFEAEANRIYRCIAMELLRPLFSVTSLDHFKEAIRDIVLGSCEYVYECVEFASHLLSLDLAHHFLAVSEDIILHRDISLHNLMVRVHPGTYEVHGVLNDFDLASLGPPVKDGHFGHRTGTRPYMSIDLLGSDTPVHLERFDWESFFYVICWIASHYSFGEEVESQAFKVWDESNDEKLRSIKAEVLYGLSTIDLDALFTDFFKPLVDCWIKPIQKMFRAADSARGEFRDLKKARPDDKTLVFDEETIGGHVTWEKLWGILKQ